jgi:Ca-activated chloride channel family protein
MSTARCWSDGSSSRGGTCCGRRSEATASPAETTASPSKEGSLIPIRDSDGNTTFVKDTKDRVVKSRLDEERLREIAETTGGFYLHLQRGTADMDELVRRGITQLKDKEGTERMSREPIERYQWPLSLAIILIAATLLINERRQKKEGVRFSNGRQVAIRI